MSVSFNKKDGNVVVVIGTGPGGGVLASELAQKGVKVVALEAGSRHGPEDFVNDEWASFGQISWLDSRSTSGSWRVAKDFSGLPSWIVKGVGGSSQHWAGASLRFQEHEWKTQTVYGNVTGASLLDWPIDAKTMDPKHPPRGSREPVAAGRHLPQLTTKSIFTDGSGGETAVTHASGDVDGHGW